MGILYTVKQGDSIDSIAFEHNLFWEAVWNHPKNKDIRALREDPDILHSGDEVYIPEKKKKAVVAQTGKSSTFIRKGVPAFLRITYEDDGVPRAGERYVAKVDGVPYKGFLDQSGTLNLTIAPHAKEAKIKIGEDDSELYRLGLLDPVDTIEGVQSRLANLGFYEGEIDGESGELTFSAIEGFQKSIDIDATGDLNQQTRESIAREHDLK